MKKEVIEFLSGKDILLDQKLVKWDILATIAHEIMLQKIGILTEQELKKILKELLELYENGIKLRLDLEDVHSNIESILIDKLGDVGKKVHTAISRNEQVIVDLKLYTKNEIIEISKRILKLADSLAKVAEKYKNSVMPGYTHHQQAMPYTFGSLLMSYFYSLMDDLESLVSAYHIINKNPLGSGAGFGLPISVDKNITGKLLGFEPVQYNSLYHMASRGKNEFLVLSAITQLMLDLNRIAEDFIMFSMKEFDFVELSDEYATGSSIMPNKKNPDVFEIVKGRSSAVIGKLVQVIATMKNLPSGYHRDLQETKSALMDSIDETRGCLDIIIEIIGKMKVNENKMKSSLNSSAFATHYALSMVEKGKPYKEAYKIVGKKLKAGEIIPKFHVKPDLGDYNSILVDRKEAIREMESEFKNVIENLVAFARSYAK